ncbi:MAG TPA: copper chaperone PCu(A)C [Acidimicrobiia bacterium]|nr:copper chaperone PCu(A)C [Acidimicrobiia bacterium]
MRKTAAVTILIAGIVTGCQGGGGIEVTDARIGAPTGPNAALYFTATNGGGEPDVLVGAGTDVAASVEVHETTHGDDGTMGMRPVAGVDLPAGKTLTLEPGGFHVMLLDVEPLEEGEVVTVTLRWQSAGEMEVEAVVVSPAETATG